MSLNNSQDEFDMDDEATQPSTQQKMDPRRVGRNNSGLNESDISDVLCILIPASSAALRIVSTTAQLNPQHILQNLGLGVEHRGMGMAGNVGLDGSSTERETLFLESMGSDSHPQDLALRFSSRVNNPAVGFCFGRNTLKCDINLDANNQQKRVSNTHFRIYVKASNGSGIIMLEDLSTNGTVVDGITLGGKKTNLTKRTHMLSQGSIIEILAVDPADIIKFIVRIPSREGFFSEYTAKFQAYMEHVQIAEQRQRAAKEGPPIPEAAARGMLAAPLAGPPNTKTIPAFIPPGMNNDFGIHWSGGDEYKCTAVLGKGAFAVVYQLAAKMDGELYACKELEKRRFVKNGVLDHRLDSEMKIMKDLRHPNIVQYIDYHETDSHLYIIMEFVPCGDLQGYVQAHHTLPEPKAKTMTRQILGALTYLHARAITHRDIKPDNILISCEDPFVVKLTDFGLSKVVKNEETFLKTFCGTLLYCAPEVFPHYDNYVADQKQKRRRRGDQPPVKSRYNHSVDIWSYAAVLWFVLCSHPAYEGVNDANGRGMFNRIMETPLDATPLRERNISEACIDLLLRMLNTDPASRPLEHVCLAHPWLKDGTALPLDAIGRGLAVIPEGEEELDASGLSIHEASDDSEGHGENNVKSTKSDDDASQPQPKRVKSEGYVHLPRDSELESSSEMSIGSIPLVHDISQIQFPMPSGAKQNRLFGEIGSSSALRSSGVLGDGGGAPQIGVSREGKSDQPTMGGQEQHPLQPNVEDNDKGVELGPTLQNEQVGSSNTQEIAAAASLLGAESLVRELNMESPNPGSSAAQVQTEPEVPKTPDGEHNQATYGRTGQDDHGATEEVTPKQPVFSRQINLPISASLFYDPHDPSTHNIEYASRVSGLNFLDESSVSNIGVTSLPETAAQSFRSAGSLEAMQRKNTTSTSEATGEQDKENQQQPQRPAPQQSTSVFPSASPIEFLKPPPRVGRLTSTPESFTTLALSLTQRITFWGRALENTIVYHDPADTRVPKTGLEIWFHAKGVEDAERAGQDWTRVPDLVVYVRTRSRHGIRVNGVPLAECDERGRQLFGRLYTGDTIRVTPGEKGPGLTFVCEFFYGMSALRRGPAEPRFVVEVSANGSGGSARRSSSAEGGQSEHA